MNLITVVIPVYNVERYLARCLDSVLQQTYRNLEVLLVDDGSKDSSGRICDEYALQDSRVKVFHIENGGVSNARNLALANTSGEWVLFVDSDDWLELTAIERMVAFSTENQADCGIFSLLFEYGNSASKMEVQEFVGTPFDLLSGKVPVSEINKLICSPCNKLYKTKIIAENHLQFQAGIKFGEDFIFNAGFLRFAKKAASQNVAYYHYDCSTQDSGVKKLHSAYDAYIIAIEHALNNLLTELNIQDTDALKQCFVVDRWDYAINVCLQSTASKEEKVALLYQWLVKIPQTEWSFYAQRNNALKVFMTSFIKQKAVTKKAIVKSIKAIARAEKRRERINKIKRWIKGQR
jgi:glycosyltransferase involved in cell wall biosynthesis